jgi:dihydrofolate reductase
MKLVITENITLDGVIEATEEWFTPAGDEAGDASDVETVICRHMAQQDGLLLGRVTFEAFRGYWPNQTDDTTGITDHLNRVKKYVVSTTLDEPGWANTTILRSLNEVAELRRAQGRELGVTGSISVARQLIAAGLVDEFRLFVYPIVLGRGECLFAAVAERADLRLVEATPFRSGIVLLTYQSR